MNRGFVAALFFVVLVVAIAGGIAWWALTQDQSNSPAVNSADAQIVPVVFYYTATKATKVDFPFGLFRIVGEKEILGANYVRIRGASTAVYYVLGVDAGAPLAPSCYWVVNASIEVTNLKRDVETYAYMGPPPALVAADLVRVISHDKPQQSCSTP